MKAPQSATLGKTPWQEGIEKVQEVELPGEVRAFANDDLLKNIRFMVKPAKEFEGEPLTDAMQIPRLEAKKKLQEELDRKLSRAESEWLNDTWGEMVSDAEIEKILGKLQPKTDYPQIGAADEEVADIA